MGSIALTHVGTYRRRVGASVARIWENVLDWEHLPWLHRSTFCDVRLLEARRDGWRVSAGLQPAGTGVRVGVETHLERGSRRYLTLTTDGPGQGTEIWTSLEPAAEGATDIEVRFLVPDVPPDRATAIGEAHVRLYTRLWDEDEGMMIRRTELLGRGPSRPDAPHVVPATLDLGGIDSVRSRLPMLVELAGRRYRLIDIDGEIVAHGTVCPHLLGPLEDAVVAEGCIRCPWHGYRFDVRTGQSADRPKLWLEVAPSVRIDPRTLGVTITVPGTPPAHPG